MRFFLSFVSPVGEIVRYILATEWQTVPGRNARRCGGLGVPLVPLGALSWPSHVGSLRCVAVWFRSAMI